MCKSHYNDEERKGNRTFTLIESADTIEGDVKLFKERDNKSMQKQELFERMKGRLIVSCQALPGEPLYRADSVMYLMARAAKQAGAAAIRTNGVGDVKAIKEETCLPVIGIIKINYEGYDSYITPTMKEIDELVAADADIVALDCTMRRRGDGTTVNEFIAAIRRRHPQAILMGDIATYEEGINAWRAGIDLLGTTMSGYTPQTQEGKSEEPDWPLLRSLSGAVDIPVIGEGRIHTPQQAVEALRSGAFAVVVGGAITRPLEITRRFVDAIENSACVS